MNVVGPTTRLPVPRSIQASAGRYTDGVVPCPVTGAARRSGPTSSSSAAAQACASLGYWRPSGRSTGTPGQVRAAGELVEVGEQLVVKDGRASKPGHRSRAELPGPCVHSRPADLEDGRDRAELCPAHEDVSCQEGALVAADVGSPGGEADEPGGLGAADRRCEPVPGSGQVARPGPRDA